MMSTQSIRDTLVRAGYEFVQLEPRIPDAKASWSPDVVAWAADAGGTPDTSALRTALAAWFGPALPG